MIHELTAIDAASFGRSIDKMFAETNRLRTEGTDHLLAAAKAAGARRFIAAELRRLALRAHRRAGQVGGRPASDEHPPKTVAETLGAIKSPRAGRHARPRESRALALRYGGFYGPGTSIALNPDGEQVADGPEAPAFRWSATAPESGRSSTSTMPPGDNGRRSTEGEPGVYNVVDDEPAPGRVMLPELAKDIGAKPPRHLPRWVGRLAGGEGVTS